MSEMPVSAVTAHLWQSTLVMGVVWLATLALQANRPRVRYWLWVAASVKFLVPFSWLVALGAEFEWRTAPPITQPAATFVMEQVLTPPVVTAATAAASMPVQPVAAALPWVLASIWALGCVVVLFWWWRQSRPLRTALREATRIELAPEHNVQAPVVWSSASMIEPGVVGIWRPVLLLPEGLVERLTSTQLKAVIAHEKCHIRCYDNLAAAIHMLVEALFWFHPGVWWLERRLVDERERACDEAVLAGGNDPADYAEGILTVCRFTVSAPLACVTGVSGADLRSRLESIGRNERGARMTFPRRVAVAFLGVVLVGIPIVTGVVTATPLLAIGQEPKSPLVFEVAAVRRNNSGQTFNTIDDELPGGRFTATNVPLRSLIRRAYGIPETQLVDAPAWTQTERFDIDAKLEREPPAVPDGELGERDFALQSLLADRFKLVVRRETRVVPLYALRMARADRKPGPMLRSSSADCSIEAMPAQIAATRAGKPLACGTLVRSGRIRFGGRRMSDLAKTLSSLPYIGRVVVDQTGLTGNWEFELTYTPDPDQLPPQPGGEPPAFDPNGPSLFAAFQEQLGLKLEAQTGPVEVLVVDRVERLDVENGSREATVPQPAERPSFEVASIKRNVSVGQLSSMNGESGGRMVVTNHTLLNIIRQAHRLQRYQIVGGPDWVDKDRWDILAKAAGDAPFDRLLGMMDTLLADRFKLLTHREAREMPVYALVLARSDGRLGPQAKASTVDCAAIAAAQKSGGALPPAPAGWPRCGININNNVLRMSGQRMTDLARNLSIMTDRFVVDRSGLNGIFDLELQWNEVDGPSLATAVQEQLGLKLEAQRAPVDVMVIDSAQRPVED